MPRGSVSTGFGPPGQKAPDGRHQAAYVPAGPLTSPALELSGFGSFPAISTATAITLLTVTVNEFATDPGMAAPGIELWDYSGAQPAQIGVTQPGTPSTSSTNLDVATFTGVTCSQLPTLRVRIYANQGTAPPGAQQYVNWASVAVTFLPGNAAAGLASGTGAAPNPNMPKTVAARLATATGTAQNPQTKPRFITAGLATAAGAAPDATVQTASGPANAPAGLATGTGAALGQDTSATFAAATGTNAGAATGTGTAQPAVAALGANAGAATGTGTAPQAGGQNAGLTSGTAAAQPATAAIGANAGLATGTGTAQSPTVQTSGSTNALAGLATGTGAALSPLAALGANAGAVTGTGTAPAATAAAGVNAGAAQGTGTAQPAVAALGANAGLASGTGTAPNATVTTSGNANAPAGLASGTAAAQPPTASVAVTAGAATGTGTAPGATGQTSRNAAAGLASGAGLAPAPALTLAALAQAAAAQALGAALGPTVAAQGAFTVGSLTASTAALGTLTASSAAGTGTTCRLMDGAAGRPGIGSSGTQPPASPAAYSGSYIAGLVFRTSRAVWFQGYWWYVPPGGDTNPVRFALWQAASVTTGLVVPGSTVTSGTLTAGAFSYTALPAPLALSVTTPYIAAMGMTTAIGFPVTQNQFGTGNPYASGITNGPVSAFGSGTVVQMPFSTAGADPAVTMPSANDRDDNLWLDVQVTDTAPPGTSYRLWPNRPYSVGDGANGGVSTDTNGYTMSVQFSVSQPAALKKIWFYSAPALFGGAAAVALPGRCGVWDVASQTVVAGTDNASPAWKKPDGSAGAAGGGWLYCDYSAAGVTLNAGQGYKAAVWYAGGSTWRTVVDTYWSGAGDGASGITMGILTAPASASATPGQNSWHGPNLAWHYPDTFSFPENDWIDVEVT